MDPNTHPIPVELIDGSSASPVTHYFPSRLKVHGTHSEDITFDVIQLAHFQVVLGFPWLALHKPGKYGTPGRRFEPMQSMSSTGIGWGWGQGVRRDSRRTEGSMKLPEAPESTNARAEMGW